MKLSAPKSIVFLISVILIVLGLVAFLIPGGSGFLGTIKNINLGYWLTFAGGVLLSLGVLLKGF